VRITYELLEEHGACGEAEVFREYFPNGVNVTPALCVEYAEDFDWTWAARHLLTTDHQRAQYDALYDNAARQRQNDTSDIAHLATSNGEYTTRVSELTRILHRRLARAFGELASERPLSTFDTPFTDDEVNPEPSTSKDVTPASESAAKPTTPSESVASAHVEFVPLDSNIGVIQRAITNMQEAMTNIVDTEVETLPSGRPARMTHQMVLSHNPCAFGYQRFVDAYPESEYPDGIPVTVPVLRRHAESVDVEWLAGRFFSGYGSPTMGRFHQLNLNIFTRYQEDERHSVGGTGIDAQRARRKLYFDRRARAFVELYRALAERSVLMPLMAAEPSEGTAFRAGVARGAEGGGLARLLFAARSNVQAGRMEAGDAASFLWGVVIGSDVRENLPLAPGAACLVAGAPMVAPLFAAAVRQLGGAAEIGDSDGLTAAGFLRLAALLRAKGMFT